MGRKIKSVFYHFTYKVPFYSMSNVKEKIVMVVKVIKAESLHTLSIPQMKNSAYDV